MFISQCNNKEVGKMRVRRRDTRIWFMALGLFAAVFLFTFLSHNYKKIDEDVQAANLANFNPGYIISDFQMGNYQSMTEAEIQAFLTMKNPCDNTDYNYYLRLSANPNYTWHFENGHFICISEEKFGDGEVIGSGDTAAHIIWQAAQDYQINPQVLIVLLQKETGLITDRIPNNGDYRKATGYGCPDTAPCSAQYYGFKNQIRKAASLFRVVLDGGWTNYPLGENYIQYNPNAACGGSVVNIRNLATSSLYRYTPYQPNAAALAAGYGTAYCGAYGNRNFYHYFEDWFGGITKDNKTPIERYYEQIGKENSVLGQPISEERCGLVNDGCYQKFEVGRIYYTESTGAWDISGKIYAKWFELGTEWSVLGYPTSSEKKDKNNIVYQQFEHGRIYYRAGETFVVYLNSENRYEEIGALDSELGRPSEEDNHCGLKNDGCYQQFEHGRIYKTEKTGEWEISDEILNRWEEINSDNSIIGYPTSGEQKDENEVLYQQFERGRIYYTEGTGAWDISGKIYTKWSNLLMDSVLGYPTSGEQKDENDIIYQQFEHGRIYYRAGETWVIPDWAQERYETIGALDSVLKTPISDGKCGLINDGCYQNYKIGRMYYSPNTGAQGISGKIYAKWFELGTEWSVLGYPTSGEQKDENDIIYQQFEHGRIYYRAGETWVENN